MRLIGEFLILNILTENILYNYPEERLRGIFGKMFTWLTEQCEEANIKPQHFIISYNSNIMDHPVNFHLHSLNADVVDILYHKFLSIDQSGMMRYSKDSITTQSFIVDITAIEPAKQQQQEQEIGRKKRKSRHYGTGRKRKSLEFRHNISLDSIIPLQNNDKFCLFRSLELLRKRAILTSANFYQYKKRPTPQKKDIKNLMEWCGFSARAKSYAIEDVGNQIAKYYDHLHPKRFRIFAFGECGEFKPFWASGNADTEFEEPLCLLFTEGNPGHYEPILNPGSLFGESKIYCFAVCTFKILVKSQLFSA